MIELTDATYKRFLKDAEAPVMLFFKASFCGPSAMLEPLVEQIETDYARTLTVVGVDVESCPVLTRAMEVKQTPTLVILHAAQPIATVLGTMSEKYLTAFIDRALQGETI